MEFKLDKTLGYKYIYDPKHKLANKSGKVYEHIYVMVQHLGRNLTENECIHHINRDRSDNRIENLLLLSNEEHGLLHWLEKEYIPVGSIKTLQDLYVNQHFLYEDRVCTSCNTVFNTLKISDQQFCSKICGAFARRKIAINPEIDKDYLNQLVWEMPTIQVAKLLNVSDVAVGKWCKKLGIPKPPRGYWAKKKANKS